MTKDFCLDRGNPNLVKTKTHHKPRYKNKYDKRFLLASTLLDRHKGLLCDRILFIPQTAEHEF
jgi:hypothetical protein